MRTLTLAQARRIALAAQGFGRPRPAQVTARDVRRVIDQVAQFQIDSVNVVARAAYLPLFSRLGPYDTALLDAAAGRAPRTLFEYWGHEASLIDVRLAPAMTVKMRRAHPWGSVERIRTERPEFVAAVLDAVAARSRGVTARDLDDGGERLRRDHWGWNWSDARRAAELLFHDGEITVARRNASFERVYALPSRVLPRAVVDAPVPELDEALDTLMRRALRALGVARAASLADYFRLSAALAKASLARLEARGEAEVVQVAGLAGEWFLDPGARRPRAVDACALVSPFDSLCFHRPRLATLFGFDYTIEIYVPAAKRRYGYYVYPFLLGERFAGRVDLKADRHHGVLRVRGAWHEPDVTPDAVASALAGELASMAAWLGLARVEVEPRGTLAPALSRAVGASSHP